MQILSHEPPGSRLYLRDIIYARALKQELDAEDIHRIIADLSAASRRPNFAGARSLRLVG